MSASRWACEPPKTLERTTDRQQLGDDVVVATLDRRQARRGTPEGRSRLPCATFVPGAVRWT